jgi:putative glycosyltransferase (TIGR04372 family)
MESKVCKFQRSQEFAEAGVVLIENTAEEILDLAKEMNDRLDEKFKTAKEDEELQNKFRSLYKPHHLCYGTPARIGAKFLRKNRELLK